MLKKIIYITLTLSLLASSAVSAQETKTKFYNFDDLMIDGNYQKPQVLYTDSRSKVKFEKLLRLKRDFLKRLKATAADASLR